MGRGWVFDGKRGRGEEREKGSTTINVEPLWGFFKGVIVLGLSVLACSDRKFYST